jgi:hypothetical protein
MNKHGAKRESGRRSKLEDDFAAVISDLGLPVVYEQDVLKYQVPVSYHKYIIDFTLPNGIYIECKGYLRDYDERHKYQLIKEQHPEADIRFVFANPYKMITRTKMTHADWCNKYGFPWCSVHDHGTIKEWSSECK